MLIADLERFSGMTAYISAGSLARFGMELRNIPRYGQFWAIFTKRIFLTLSKPHPDRYRSFDHSERYPVHETTG
jgi:hypothetical protein